MLELLKSLFKPKKPDMPFQSFILRCLKDMTIREVAIIAKTSLPTVQSWASGQSHPHPFVIPHIIKALEPELSRREQSIKDSINLKTPSREEQFQSFILRALKVMTIHEVASIIQVQVPLVQRYASGDTGPRKPFDLHIINLLEPELLKREKALEDW